MKKKQYLCNQKQKLKYRLFIMHKIKTYLLLTLVCAFFCSLEVSATEYTIAGLTFSPTVELKGTTAEIVSETVTINKDLSDYSFHLIDDNGEEVKLDTVRIYTHRDKLALSSISGTESSSSSAPTITYQRCIADNGSFSLKKYVSDGKTKVVITFYPNTNYVRRVYTVTLGVKVGSGWSRSDPSYGIPLVLNNYDAAREKSYNYEELSTLLNNNFYLATRSGGASASEKYRVVSCVRNDFARLFLSSLRVSSELTEGQRFRMKAYFTSSSPNTITLTALGLAFLDNNNKLKYLCVKDRKLAFTDDTPNATTQKSYFLIDKKNGYIRTATSSIDSNSSLLGISDNSLTSKTTLSETAITADIYFLGIKDGSLQAIQADSTTSGTKTTYSVPSAAAKFLCFDRLENESAEYNQLKVLRPANGATSTLNLASNNANDYFTFDVTFDYPVAHDASGNVLDMYGRKLVAASTDADSGSDLIDIWVDFTESDGAVTNEAPKDRGLLKIKRGSLAGASVNVQAAPNTVQFTMNVGAMCAELDAASSSTNNAPMMKVLGPRKIKRGSLAGASVNVQMAPGAVGNADVAFATLPAASSAPRMGLMRTAALAEYADLVSPKLGVTYNIENSGYGQTEVPVNSYGLSTFYTEDPLSVNLNDEVKFYKVKSTDADGTINLERVTGIVKGPFMVAGTTTCLYNSNSQATTTESTSYPKLSVAKPGETIKSTNTISGTLLGKPISITMYSYLYGRMNASDPTPAFHKLNVDRVLPSDVNDAKYKPWVVYLQTKTKINPTSGSPIIVKLYEGIEQDGDEPEATYIYMVGDDGEGRLVPVSDESVYNVMGQKVSANYNGVVIRKGKKVFNGKN